MGSTVRAEVLRISARPWLPRRDRGHLPRVKGANPQRRWVLDADLAAAFDRIDHDHLLAQLGTFPARGLIAGWLKAGVIENGPVRPDRGGNSSGRGDQPVLLNVALHGMEQAAGVRYQRTGVHAGTTVPGSPVLVRYADDLVALCHTRDQAEQVKARLAGWLAPRGLAFNEDKTRIVHLDDGFDFLGFNVRRQSRQAADQTEQGGRETDPGTAAHRDASPCAGPTQRR